MNKSPTSLPSFKAANTPAHDEPTSISRPRGTGNPPPHADREEEPMSDALQGVFPVFQTPFDKADSIDFSTLEQELQWLVERGADGVVMAMVSETLRLSSDERDQLAAFTCSTLQGKVPVIISVGAESTHTTVRHARAATRAGATALMAIPPVATRLNDDGMMSYYQAILDASPLPLIIQDASGYIGNAMSLSLQVALLEQYGPERILFKPEANPIGPKLSHLRDATGGRARVFEGSGGLALLDTYPRGIVGTMPGAELIDAQVALWGALKKSDATRAMALSEAIVSLVTLQAHSLDGFLVIEKYLLQKQGIFSNSRLRGPTGFDLDSETQSEVDRRFARLQSLVTTR